MRISEHYNLNRTQPTLDFVDVDIHSDVRFFVDPSAIRRLPSEWGDECVSLIQSFFRTVLLAIRDGRDSEARTLLATMHEPNETHLGYSRLKARGHALGPKSAHKVWDALRTSEAAKSGLLEDLEDTILMVEHISSDIVSDITTNIIREPLINYTRDTCTYLGIPLDPDVASGPLWDPNRLEWYTEFTQLPVAPTGRLLLVPKVIIRHRMDYDQDEYYRHYLLEHLREVELDANSELVELLRDGRRRVTKKDLASKYGTGKTVIVRETRSHPEILAKYRADKRNYIRPPLTHREIAAYQDTADPDWTTLLNAVRSTPVGKSDASNYERAIESLLTAIFYPSLANPQVQFPIHEGRKRVDITYTNVASSGFFDWLAKHYSAAHIFVECKNYRSDIRNPELDQIAGRFSPSRGQVSLVVCRSFDNKELFLTRCADTAHDARGFIIVLDDDDLGVLVQERAESSGDIVGTLLMERFRRLVM
ncbi:MAG: hypothetical protein IPJ58_14930 [Ardenticatenia bacterium]|nr:hypothetical protein [Ardenticatenia bacterium]